MTDSGLPRSILKKSIPASPSKPLDNPRYTARHKELALQHATVIQQRKDAEAQILTAIEEILDFPNATTSAADPALEDVSRFRTLIAPFSTTDYDDLIEERSLAERCGYPLCPNPFDLSKRQPKAKYRLDFSRAGQISKKINDEKPMQFCCRECARRAMYVKIQLSEVPYWERLGGHGGEVELMKEDDLSKIGQKIEERDHRAEDERQLQKAMEELALERGEKADSTRPAMVMERDVLEKMSLQTPSFPQEAVQADDSIEGYAPRFAFKEDEETS